MQYTAKHIYYIVARLLITFVSFVYVWIVYFLTLSDPKTTHENFAIRGSEVSRWSAPLTSYDVCF